jgi:CheY-like chemotaxis protein
MSGTNAADVAVPYKVMVVEDDRELRQLLKLSLDTKLEADVLVATDGFMAVMMARGEQPDLILMDLSMPYVDGFQAIQLIKNDGCTSHIPIIALSNYTWDYDWKQKALSLGCVSCLNKSESVTDIVHLVQDFLGSLPLNSQP